MRGFVVLETPVLPFFLGNRIGEAVIAPALEAFDSPAEVGLVKPGLLFKFELELAATTVRCGLQLHGLLVSGEVVLRVGRGVATIGRRRGASTFVGVTPWGRRARARARVRARACLSMMMLVGASIVAVRAFLVLRVRRTLGPRMASGMAIARVLGARVRDGGFRRLRRRRRRTRAAVAVAVARAVVVASTTWSVAMLAVTLSSTIAIVMIVAIVAAVRSAVIVATAR